MSNNHIRFDRIKGILCDIDGVIWESQENKEPLPGVIGAIEFIKRVKRLPVRFVTNTTTRSLSTLYDDIRRGGFAIERDEIVTPPKLAAEYLRKLGRPSVMLVMREDTKSEFEEFPRDEQHPDYIVVGNNTDRWDYRLLDRLFHLMMDGSRLLALHKQKYWHNEGKLSLDIGAIVTGLEYSTGKTAIAIGKPEPLFFRSALEEIDVPPGEAIMIGDDIETDIGGAKAAGLRGVLVKTGKYREDFVRQSAVTPDLVIGSLAELPDHL